MWCMFATCCGVGTGTTIASDSSAVTILGCFAREIEWYSVGLPVARAYRLPCSRQDGFTFVAACLPVFVSIVRPSSQTST